MHTKPCPEVIREDLSKLGFTSNHIEQLETYVNELILWSASINLIGKSTIADVWSRHILDCAQVAAHVPKSAQTAIDIGSGAGLPGLVLASLRQYQVHLVEPNRRKVAFLHHMASCLGLDDLQIHPCRIEDVDQIKADVIISRAFADPNTILNFSQKLLNEETCIIFFCGQAISLKDMYQDAFHVRQFPSLTQASSSIARLEQKA